MTEIAFGDEVAELQVILQAGSNQSFGIELVVEAAELAGIAAELDWDERTYTAELTGTTYLWRLDAEDVALMPAMARARLSLVSALERVVLARGRMEVRS